MKKRILWIITVVFIVALALSACEKEEKMAIKTDGSAQYIYWSASNLSGITSKSISYWIYKTAYATDRYVFLLISTVDSASHENNSNSFDVSNNGDISFTASFSTEQGVWRSAGSTIPLNTLTNVVITFDGSSYENNPILYINGASTNFPELFAPSGSYVTSSNNPYIFLSGKPNESFIGSVFNPRIYNRILSAAEVAEIYTARGADNIKNGLVFCPVLYGAKGLQVFDGSTLSTANLIIDPCSGATGVPTGSPIAVGETYLRIKP